MDTKPTPQNIQDSFLNAARRERETVTVYLMNGAKLSGRIKSFDKFSVLLESGANEQLIFKHAISTILHARRSGGGGGGDRAPAHAHEAATPPTTTAAAAEHAADTSGRTES